MTDTMTQTQPQDLFRKQLEVLGIVRQLDFRRPEFIAWKDSTMNLFQRFLQPESAHLIRFRDLRFRGPIQAYRPLPYNYRGPRHVASDTISQADQAAFQRDCAIAEGCIKGAIEDIQYFGVHSESTDKKPRQYRSGAVQQTFLGPVIIQNQSIATDNAIQNIGQMGPTGSSLKEIAAVFNDSLELTGHERLCGLKAVEIIATENAKPEATRNWKSILDNAGTLMTIASKAGDLAGRLAHHLPVIAALIHEAMKNV